MKMKTQSVSPQPHADGNLGMGKIGNKREPELDLRTFGV